MHSESLALSEAFALDLNQNQSFYLLLMALVVVIWILYILHGRISFAELVFLAVAVTIWDHELHNILTILNLSVENAYNNQYSF